MQEKLGKQLLWCACRHHIGEIVLTHLWDDLKIETSKGPSIKLFSRFRENFLHLKVEEVDHYKYASPDVRALDISAMCKKDITEQILILLRFQGIPQSLCT